MFMSYGSAVHTADADFIVGSILSGAAPWLQLSSETTLEYAFFGGDSPFANWVGQDPYAWEAWPTPESLFLTHDLGERIRTWVREFARCAHVDCCGLPAVGGSTFVDTALEGLRLADLIRSELPYYYVEATFFDSVPQAVIDRLDAEVPDRSGYRKLDGRTDVIDWQAMLFQPFGSSQMPPELSTMSAAIMANVDRYGGRVVDPAADVWAIWTPGRPDMTRTSSASPTRGATPLDGAPGSIALDGWPKASPHNRSPTPRWRACT
ncbi:hypothetical protein CEY15_05070 [Dietzia natronolimnaea]|uniref:Uncharacterized protein n=1 Tax=Dietzia natronolimnaea TaxID=161920 RepID=A0A2A2WSC9_9ACTN|nr:hypothetical protein [Dietzia natronolimnaea]PAY24112.1 hypothetical protein CEY15_05070 [Dietzia natronolimnaea]